MYVPVSGMQVKKSMNSFRKPSQIPQPGLFGDGHTGPTASDNVGGEEDAVPRVIKSRYSMGTLWKSNHFPHQHKIVHFI